MGGDEGCSLSTSPTTSSQFFDCFFSLSCQWFALASPCFLFAIVVKRGWCWSLFLFFWFVGLALLLFATAICCLLCPVFAVGSFVCVVCLFTSPVSSLLCHHSFALCL